MMTKNINVDSVTCKESANIGIIGSGVVGSAVGKGFKYVGNNIIFYDIDNDKINNLKNDGYQATNDLDLVVGNSDIFFICVPTPDKDKQIDLSIIKNCMEKLSNCLKNKDEYFVIVVKSTVVPTTTENVLLPLIEKNSEKNVGQDFGLCFNPEFLRDKQAFEDFINPDRIVIGEYDKRSGDILEEIYSKFECPIIRTDMKTAEMTKYINNCFYATKISFFNEIHMMCSKIGIDSQIIRKVVQLDKYYGSHPWEHGHSFGGKCLPKDLNALISQFNEGHLFDPVLLKAVRKVNEEIDVELKITAN